MTDLSPELHNISPIPFVKYHALGNDYLVIEAACVPNELTPQMIATVCDRHFGVGSDGILVATAGETGFHLRIINPDGSEAEKSGNGLRIFARYLWDQQQVTTASFTVQMLGGTVQCQVLDGGTNIQVEMGQASFHSQTIPVTGSPREVLQESLTLSDQVLTFSAVTIGNPHCVILCEELAESEVHRLGPQIETAPCFPNRTNVQFVKVFDRENLQLLIWERGVGYTLASGTSSCAAAAVTHRLGLSEPRLAVHMPGGTLAIEILPDKQIRMSGPVVRVAKGQIFSEIFGD